MDHVFVKVVEDMGKDEASTPVGIPTDPDAHAVGVEVGECAVRGNGERDTGSGVMPKTVSAWQAYREPRTCSPSQKERNVRMTAVSRFARMWRPGGRRAGEYRTVVSHRHGSCSAETWSGLGLVGHQHRKGGCRG